MSTIHCIIKTKSALVCVTNKASKAAHRRGPGNKVSYEEHSLVSQQSSKNTTFFPTGHTAENSQRQSDLVALESSSGSSRSSSLAMSTAAESPRGVDGIWAQGCASAVPNIKNATAPKVHIAAAM